MRAYAIGAGVLVVLIAILFLSQGFPPQLSQHDSASSDPVRYHNKHYGFSFELPEGAQVHERKEGPDTVTIRVEDIEAGKGFQIFILPYQESAISEERFLMDIPSGIREQEEGIVINGVQATAFITQDARLGTMREVWLLREGYLYEFTAPVLSETWLRSILATYKFE